MLSLFCERYVTKDLNKMFTIDVATIMMAVKFYI